MYHLGQEWRMRLLSSFYITAWPYVLTHHLMARQIAFRNQSATKCALVLPTESSLHHSRTFPSPSILPSTLKPTVHISSCTERLWFCPASGSLKTQTGCAEDRLRGLGCRAWSPIAVPLCHFFARCPPTGPGLPGGCPFGTTDRGRSPELSPEETPPNTWGRMYPSWSLLIHTFRVSCPFKYQLLRPWWGFVF